MNIVHVITGLTLGGAERMLLSVCEALVSRGHRVVVVFISPSANAMLPIFVEKGVEIVSFDLKSRVRRLNNFIKLIFFIRQLQFDIVHCHLIHAILIGMILRMLFRMRVIVTIHSTTEGGGIFRYILRSFMRFFNKIIYISDHVANAFGGDKSAPNSVVLHNFIDFESLDDKRTLPSSFKSLSFCTVSRLEEIKNIDRIIYSFALFHENMQNSVLDIYGAGQAEAYLIHLIDELNLSHCVTLKGPVNSAYEVLNSYHFFVTACVSEGFGLSLLEAASHGLFCIAVDNPSHRFILDGSNYCYIFHSENTDFIQSAYKRYSIAQKNFDFDSYYSRLKLLFSFDSYMIKLQAIYSECL